MTDALTGDLRRFDGTQFRTATFEEVNPDEGTVLMRAAPYGVTMQLAEQLWERFERGTFERACKAPHRVKLWHNHAGALIGHAKDVEEREDGSWIRARFSNTLAAQEARELAFDGTLDQCSVEFKPMRDHMAVERRSDGMLVRHSRAHLIGVALVPHGAYAEHAFVASVRDDTDKAREAAIARLASLTA